MAAEAMHEFYWPDIDHHYGLSIVGRRQWQRAEELRMCRAVLEGVYATEDQQALQLNKVKAYRAK